MLQPVRCNSRYRNSLSKNKSGFKFYSTAAVKCLPIIGLTLQNQDPGAGGGEWHSPGHCEYHTSLSSITTNGGHPCPLPSGLGATWSLRERRKTEDPNRGRCPTNETMPGGQEQCSLDVQRHESHPCPDGHSVYRGRRSQYVTVTLGMGGPRLESSEHMASGQPRMIYHRHPSLTFTWVLRVSFHTSEHLIYSTCTLMTSQIPTQTRIFT